MKLKLPHGLFLLAILALAPLVLNAQQDARAEAIQAFKAGEYSKATGLLKKLAKANEKDGEAWYMLGTSYYKQNKYKDAIKAL
ncbi:MAG: CDC27 family protein, partial [Pyrinomonadaceae bacterium]